MWLADDGKPPMHPTLFQQELAFIRGLKRAATVVCLERSELLSVEKEDFFSAKIDLSFNADMQRRVEYIK